MNFRTEDWLDGWSMGASLLCAVHCLLLPLLVVSAPILARLFGLGDVFHLLVLILALPVSGAALLLGHRRHRRVMPPLAGAAGLVLIAAPFLFAQAAAMETGLSVSGGAALLLAHLANWRMRRRAPGPA